MPREKEAPPKKRKPAYFWWTLANVLALCVAILSWLLCLHVFNHPEIPRNYEILRKLGRAQSPQPLKVIALPDELPPPQGESADPRALYRRYAALPNDALGRLNAALMRNYLTNLKETKLIQYVEGDYRVDEVRKLTRKDLFSPGVAVKARAMLPPDQASDPAPWPVEIEYLFPTASTEAAGWMSPGDMLTLNKFPNFAMVLHVARLDGEDTPLVRLTVVPVAFGDFTIGPDQKFQLEAPAALHPGGPLPVFRRDEAH